MKAPTIAEIKYRTMENVPHFFDRGTLKFFGQTMRSFKVRVSPQGNVYIYAPSYWKDDRLYQEHHGGLRLMGYTFRQYKDNDLVDTGMKETYGDCLTEIEAYIKAH